MNLAEVVTPRRLVTTALLILVGVLCVYGLQTVQDNRIATCGAGNSGTSPIKVLYPCPGDSDLRQGRIGVSLADGYTADLYVDNVQIPKDQLRLQGPDVFFTPGPGTETGALAPALHSAKVVVYKLLQEPAQGITYAWSFSTH